MLDTTAVTGMIYGKESVDIGGMSASLPANSSVMMEQLTFTDGTGSLKAQNIAGKTVSLASGASYVFDLQAIAGLAGNVNFTNCKAIAMVNHGEGATDILEWGDEGTTTNPWLSLIKGTNARVAQQPNTFLVSATGAAGGFDITPTNKNLKVVNTGTNVVSATLKIMGEHT